MRNFWVGIIVFLVILLCIWMQQNIINAIPLFGAIANIGIILVVTLGLISEQKIGATVGIVYGLLLDILFGKTIGIYTLLFFIMGIFCGKIGHGFSKDNKSSVVMVVALVTVIYEIINYLLFVVIYKYDFELFSSIWTIILECVYNIFLTIILFKPFSFLGEIINKGKSSYYLL